MLRKLRILLATVSFILITLLFLDFSGALHSYFGWMAKLQFIPALLASSFVTLIAIVVITVLFGRIYCSVICPLGVYQDGIARMVEKRKKNSYHFKKSVKYRYFIALVFFIWIAFGNTSIANFIEPYSIFGRFASNIFSPVYRLINNVLAYFAERWNSYAFYHVDVYVKSLPMFIVAIAYFLIITVLALTNGRWYCNSICQLEPSWVACRNSPYSSFISTRKNVSAAVCARKTAVVRP